jgi:hypothetical protein
MLTSFFVVRAFTQIWSEAGGKEGMFLKTFEIKIFRLKLSGFR